MSNWNGADTSITISNTSSDPFGTTPTSGICSISYFGAMINGGSTPANQFSNLIPSGGQLSFTLSQGNLAQGIAGAPGFRGYVIASCGFTEARGLATSVHVPTPITIQTSPPGLQFSLNGGVPMTAPKTLSVFQGTYTLAVAPTQAGTSGTQYVFAGWSDSGAATHSINVGSSTAAYVANFTTQYQLTTSASPPNGGTVSGAGFYTAIGKHQHRTGDPGCELVASAYSPAISQF